MSSTKSYLLPNKFANTAIWLRGDLGRTIVYPSVNSPNDLTSASWTKPGATAPDATTLQATAGSGVHDANQAPSNYIAGRATVASVEFWAGTYDYIFVQIGTGPGLIGIQISTSTILAKGADVSVATITSLGSG